MKNPVMEGKKDSGSFRKAGLLILLGGGLGAAVSLALTPALARVFRPDAFGSAQTVISVASIFIGVSTMRLEILAQGRADQRSSRSLLAAASLISLLSSVAIGVAAVGLWVFGIGDEWLSLGLLVFAGSIQLVAGAKLALERRYGQLALGSFGQVGGTSTVQLLLGLASPSIWAMLSGFLIARLAWIPFIKGLPYTSDSMRDAQTHRKTAQSAAGSALINNVSSQLPLIAIAGLFGTAVAGQYAMTLRLLLAPLNLIGQAAATAALGEVGQLIRTQEGGARRVVLSGMRDLAATLIIPIGATAALATELVPHLLGPSWDLAGKMTAIMCFGALFQVVVAPFSQLLNMAGRTDWLLRWDVVRLTTLAVCIGMPFLLGLGPISAVTACSIAMVVLYLALARLILGAVAAPSVP